MKTIKSDFFKSKKEFIQTNFNKKKIDKTIINIAYFILFLGNIVVLSASYGASKSYSVSALFFFMKHVVFCIASIILIHIFAKQKNRLQNIGKFIWVLSIILLIVTLFLGSSVKGARRWISFFGFSFQPSELAKIGVLIQGSFNYKSLKNLLIIYMLPILLIIIQPDLGTSFVIMCLGLFQVLIKNFKWKYIIIGILALIALFFFAYFSFSHVQARIDAFFSVSDIYGKGYQKYKSYLAMKNGGFFGQGFGKGVIKDLLPDSHTDFIFSVVIEEFGILGGLCVIFSFIKLGLRALVLEPKNEYFKVVHNSVLFLITSQAWLNIASALSLIPTKGLILPLISYGGSGLIVQGIAFGILLSVCEEKSKISLKN